MTIRQIHRDDAITLEQYRAAEAAGLIRRPLTDRPIGADSTRRQSDAAASAVFTEPDRPAVTSRRRAVGPRGFLLANGELAYNEPTTRKEPTA